jgi:hypothetical protein
MLRPRGGTLLSLGLHALAGLALSRAIFHDTQPATEDRTTVFWLTLPERPAAQLPPASPSTDEPIAVAPEESRRQIIEEPLPTEDATDSPDGETPSAPSPATRADRSQQLVEARERAISDFVTEQERAGSHRSFLFPGTLREQRAFEESKRLRRVERGLQQPLTAFDSPSKGRAGLTGTAAAGQEIQWTSNDCYRIRGTGNLFAYGDMVQQNPLSACARPRPRGDLFATAKPSYLMDEDERAEADAAFQRRERLRRETTGAVLQLE